MTVFVNPWSAHFGYGSYQLGRVEWAMSNMVLKSMSIQPAFLTVSASEIFK